MVFRLALLNLLLLLSPASASPVLPNGHDQAVWGITVSELKKQMDVSPVERTDPFGYAEHLEEDPEVYFWNSPQHERVEFYFYEGRLYKIFIVYDRIYFHTRFYEKLVEETTAAYGKPQDTYQEEFFGIPILHARWEDSASVLDLRKGAGFIYQVRIDKMAAEKKAKERARKKSI